MELCCTYIETNKFMEVISFYEKILQIKPNIYTENRWVEFECGNKLAIYNRKFDEEKIKILSESIKNYGVLQPIVLKPDDKGKYMIIAGERRYRASKLARKSDIPAVIKDIPMKDIMEIALIENLQRE